MGDNRKTKRFLDLSSNGLRSDFINYGETRELAKRGNPKSTLFSHGRRTELFFANNPSLYFSSASKKRAELKKRVFNLDSVSIKSAPVSGREIFDKDEVCEFLKNKYADFRKSILNFPEMFKNGIPAIHVWKMSMIGAILFGMLSMTMIYRYLGQGVSADAEAGGGLLASMGGEIPVDSQVLGAEDINASSMDESQLSDESINYMEQMLYEFEKSKKEELESKIREMVKGYPIEAMVPLIAEKDNIVAAFLIGIARKESSWGVHVPVLNGQDCFNYWGYKGPNRVGSGGHSCFADREEAVNTVAKRLEWLIENKKLNTPEKMSIWKCGSACSSDGQVGKWISDVELYFDKLNN
jgi:hypothetical protein